MSGISLQMEFKKVKEDSDIVEETDGDSPSTEDAKEILTYEPSQQ